MATLLALLALSVSPSAQDQQPIRSGARTVAVYATVTEAGGRLVPDLTRDDFEIYDNGKLQPITVFSNEVQPITIVLMLDRSGSMESNFRFVQVAAETFVHKLGPDDKARTNNQDEMIQILRNNMQEAGPTPLWNAVNVSITNLLHQERRRVVLVFTDGHDNPMNFKTNNLSVMDVMKRAQEENVMVYAVGLSGTNPAGGFGRQRGGFGGFGGMGGMGVEGPDPGLPMIAGETGGGYFELTRAEDISSTFARVADELHRQYALGFEPVKLDDKMHKLTVKIKKSGMTVRARKEYLAARER
jgi:Ca-activated chloride channel family protein